MTLTSEMKKPKLVAVVGPTASGKSALGVMLAKKFGGEIVSADSRQVYRGMDIGTGKVTKEEMAGIPHHLLDLYDPKRTFTAATYVKFGTKAINAILRRKKLPIVVGGTGFYVRALIDGFRIPKVPPDPSLRRRLEKKTTAELFLMLEKKDRARSRTIDPKNKRRIVRALEIASVLGKVPELRISPKYDALYIGIEKPAAELRRLIHDRLLRRLKQGMLAEIEYLHERKHVPWQRLENLGLEYRYGARYLQKKLSYDEMVSRLESAIWHYAKRQMTWFKKDKRIHWVRKPEEAVRLVRQFLDTK